MKIKTLLVVPALLLTSCATAKQIDATEANDIATNIAKKYEEGLKIELKIIDDVHASGITTKREMTLKYVSNDCYHLHRNSNVITELSNSSLDNASLVEDYYVSPVKDDTGSYYGVLTKTKSENEKDYTVNDLKFENMEAVTNYMMYTVETDLTSYYSRYIDPKKIIDSLIASDEHYETAYYSSGKDNLIVKVKKVDEIKELELTYSYDNYRFTGFERIDKATTSYETVSRNQKVTIKYNNNLKITLPKEWKELVK